MTTTQHGRAHDPWAMHQPQMMPDYYPNADLHMRCEFCKEYWPCETWLILESAQVVSQKMASMLAIVEPAMANYAALIKEHDKLREQLRHGQDEMLSAYSIVIRLARFLLPLEWVADPFNPAVEAQCASCWNPKTWGHKEGCAFAALVADMSKEMETWPAVNPQS